MLLEYKVGINMLKILCQLDQNMYEISCDDELHAEFVMEILQAFQTL